MKKDTLPKITKKKKFNTQKFITLAKRVRKYFEEEKEYLQKKKLENEDNKTSRFSFES